MTLRQLFIVNGLWIMSGISVLWVVIVWLSFERVPYEDVDVLDMIGEASMIAMAGIFATFIARSNMHESTKARLVAAMLCMFVGGTADFLDEFFVVRHLAALLENTFKTAAALFTLWGLLSLTREAKSSERRADHFRKISGHLSLLSQIGQKITRTQKLSDILEVVHININELASFDAFRVILIENGHPEEKLFRQPAGSQSLDNEAVEAFRMLEQWVIDNNNSLYLFDMMRCSEQYLQTHEQTQEFLHILASHRQLQSGSVFIVPIQSDKGVLGLFTIFVGRRQALDSEQCHNIESIAAYSCVAINNAMRFEEMEKHREELDQRRKEVDKRLAEIESSSEQAPLESNSE